MSKLLYITANPKPEAESISLQLGKAFLECYKQLKPHDTIIHLDLYEMDIPFLDQDVFSAWKKLSCNKPLNKIEERKINQINELTEQFISANKFIFVTPLWNLGIPPKLKMYIDCIVIKGKTFDNTKYGTIGLLKERKAIHIHARASDYSNSQVAHPPEHGDSYLRDLMAMLGIQDYKSIIAEGMGYSDRQGAKQIFEQALNKVKEQCKEFAKD